MIILDLVCELEHRFEGWFKQPTDFDKQLINGQITCPVCGVNEILKLNSENDQNNVIEIKPYSLLKEKLDRSEVTISNPEIDVGAITTEFIDRLNDFVEQHFDDLDVNMTTNVNSFENQNLISSHSEDEIEMLSEEGIAIIALPKKKKSLN